MTKQGLLDSALADIGEADACMKKAPELDGGSHTLTRDSNNALSTKAAAYAAIASVKVALALAVDANSV